jgi:hypothetical protein
LFCFEANALGWLHTSYPLYQIRFFALHFYSFDTWNRVVFEVIACSSIHNYYVCSYLCISGKVFSDRIVAYLLFKLEKSGEKGRLGSLSVLKQLVNSSGLFLLVLTASERYTRLEHIMVKIPFLLRKFHTLYILHIYSVQFRTSTL